MRKKPHETGREHGKEIGKHKPIGTALKRYGMGRDAEKSQNPRSRSLDKTGSLTVDFDTFYHCALQSILKRAKKNILNTRRFLRTDAENKQSIQPAIKHSKRFDRNEPERLQNRII